jgi:hypothetical protein
VIQDISGAIRRRNESPRSKPANEVFAVEEDVVVVIRASRAGGTPRRRRAGRNHPGRAQPRRRAPA